jgi:hypothetical protein
MVRPERSFRGQTTSIANEIRRNLDGYTDAQILHELIQNVGPFLMAARPAGRRMSITILLFTSSRYVVNQPLSSLIP